MVVENENYCQKSQKTKTFFCITWFLGIFSSNLLSKLEKMCMEIICDQKVKVIKKQNDNFCLKYDGSYKFIILIKLKKSHF